MSLHDHFQTQAGACAALGSPFTDQLLRCLADRMQPGRPVTDRLFNWPWAQLAGDAVALRLAGALHALVLQGRDAALAAVYPPNFPDDDTLWQAVSAAFDTHAGHILHWLDSAPQTNEVRRSTALLIGAAAACGHFPGLPLRVSELGASAGLNLNFDRYALHLPTPFHSPADPVLTLTPDYLGPLPPRERITVAERRGVDLNPLDPGNADDVLRLRSYIWADQADRMRRTEAALAAAEPMVDRGDAGDWLQQRLAQPVPGRLDFLYHTIAAQYFPPATQETVRRAIEKAAARATDRVPFAWLSFETDGQSPGAPVMLRLWPGGHEILLGRMDFHGRWFTAA